jgi:hypothetical protein
MGDQMANTLICLNQLRANGIIVEECPKHLAPPNLPSSHSIHSPDQDLNIYSALKFFISFFYPDFFTPIDCHYPSEKKKIPWPIPERESSCMHIIFYNNTYVL